jgi:geranylgeranyl pyrophosphate synthase
MNALVAIRENPGLDGYLDRLEERLEEAVGAYPGLVAVAGVETLAAGGKRLRPLLVFLSTSPERRDTERAVAGGAAVELVHMATLVHDDLLDGADLRRGRPTVWAAHGKHAAEATGDYLFARAFAQAFRPETTVEDYLLRCSLKTGKLFEAACLLGGRDGGLGVFGLALGVAFQIADDILDCTGDFDTTGKAGGVDLRDGTPTLPLILAARADREVRRALSGEDVPDALDRVAATGALHEARGLALEYAARARAVLDGHPSRDSLEVLTHLVVDRDA